MTVVGSVGSSGQADVDTRGRVAPLDRPWTLDWWVGADDRWHIAAAEPAVRQTLVDSVPVVRTAMRVPGGDAVQHVYGIGSPPGTVIVEFANESPLPFVVALVVRDARRVALHDAHLHLDDRPRVTLPRPPARWAATTDHTTQARVTAGAAQPLPLTSSHDRAGRLEVACLYPLAHQARLRVAVDLGPGRTPRPVDLAAVPSPAAAAKGWSAQLQRATQVELPDPRLAERVRAARAALLLAAAGNAIDAPTVAALEDWGFDAEATAGWGRLGWRDRRDASRRDPAPGTWDAVRAADGGAALLLALRALLAHESDDGTLTVLAELPPGWRGQHVEVHRAPTRHGPLSYAVRWSLLHQHSNLRPYGLPLGNLQTENRPFSAC